jgi:hypothetical protein
MYCFEGRALIPFLFLVGKQPFFKVQDQGVDFFLKRELSFNEFPEVSVLDSVFPQVSRLFRTITGLAQ